ncbi:MAG: DUF1585 domain-containing protein, partial [Alphaproteobacteria bacterium]|nr:DUF1585 domain-containing protein [Alphaproteobacteria bacterium]
TPTCASCHTHSDPIGLSLEGFNAIGGKRLSMLEDGKPVDLSATMQGKKFVGGDGLGQYLRDNPKFPACVARKLYAYGQGLDAEEVEPSAFKVAYKNFVDSGYRLRVLIKSLVLSSEFYRAAAPGTSSGLTKQASN